MRFYKDGDPNLRNMNRCW